ncbi:MAG: khg/kdpg aldolase [Anaerocolumna sp.]|jgi:2-dehydro-3-deoxyphosphogluconate aldolase/(4S)-4-hydroxy-2-oxoglutarate aldolase|nr:khg/kdpg aldolase [Anaerocolumna sp.]
MENIMKRIGDTGLVPVVVIDDVNTAVDTANALLKGGVDLMEITMRTAAGMESIRLVSEACPDMLVGAGTVLTMEQCKQAIANGAKFIVSPGFDPEIVDYCLEQNVPICPGCVTPTEITAAIKKGLKVVKFFPANVYGGIKAIKALAGPFTELQFIPTGGVSLTNLADFTSKPIYAIGGGWLCSRESINSSNFEEITDSCAKSVDVLLGLKDTDGNSCTLEEVMKNGGTVSTISKNRLASQLTRRDFVATEADGVLVFKKSDVTITVK